MQVEVFLTDVGTVFALMLDAVYVAARFDELHVTVDFLVRVVVQAELGHLVSVCNQWLLEAEHAHEHSLPMSAVVLLLGLSDPDLLLLVEICCTIPMQRELLLIHCHTHKVWLIDVTFLAHLSNILHRLIEPTCCFGGELWD